MRPAISAQLLALICFAAFAPMSAAEFDAGSYHQANCTRCHDDGVYTRENRRVQSFQKLESQVARCDANLGTRLFPEDLSQLVDYLNTSFYHFKP